MSASLPPSRRGVVHFVLLAAVPVLGIGCQAIVGIEDTTERPSAGGDSGLGGGAGSGAAAGVGGSGGSGGGSGGSSGGSGGSGGTSGSSGAGGAGATGGGDAGADAGDACAGEPDFGVVPPQSASVLRGQSVAVNVQVSLIACFAHEITVTLGTVADISAPPATIGSGQTATTLTISAASSAQLGNVTVPIGFTGGGKSHTAQLDLLVREVAGTLDQTFTVHSSGPGAVAALGVAPDGKIWVASNSTTGGAGWKLERLNADGTPDTFSPPALPNTGGVRDLVRASNGQIVLAGDVSGGVALVRMNSNGVADAVLGANGTYMLPAANFPTTISASALAVQLDDKPVVAANWVGNGVVARVDPGQSSLPVPPGKVDLQASLAGANLSSVMLSSGRIVVAGTNNSHVFLAARLNTTGDADTTFGTNGSTSYAAGAYEHVRDGVVTSNGIYLSGAIQGGADVYPALFRFNLDGGSAAHTQHNPPGAYNYSYAGIAAQSDGKLVVVGSGGTSASGYRSVLTRFNPDGSIDETFAPDQTPKGSRVFQIGGNTFMSTVAIAPDGRIIVGGSSPSGGTVARFWP